ncbi:MAG TPA: hypothetical protein VNE00_19930 [Paraburkholderia sp.]|nr:hypothetical protein [Paraburkholderia sp.]
MGRQALSGGQLAAEWSARSKPLSSRDASRHASHQTAKQRLCSMPQRGTRIAVSRLNRRIENSKKITYFTVKLYQFNCFTHFAYFYLLMRNARLCLDQNYFVTRASFFEATIKSLKKYRLRRYAVFGSDSGVSQHQSIHIAVIRSSAGRPAVQE